MKKLFSTMILLSSLILVLAACSGKEEAKEVVKEEKPTTEETQKPESNKTEEKEDEKPKENFEDSIDVSKLSEEELESLNLRGQVQKHLAFIIAQDSPEQLSELTPGEKDSFVDRSTLVEKDKAFKESLNKDGLKLESLAYNATIQKVIKMTDSEIICEAETEFLDTNNDENDSEKTVQYTFVKQGDVYLIKDYELK